MRRTRRYALVLSLAACDNAGSSAEGAAGSGGVGGEPVIAGVAGSVASSGGAGRGGASTSGAPAGVGTAPPAGATAAGAAAGGANGLPDVAGTGGGASMAPISPPGFFAGGYLTSGPWMGWVFTYTDSAGKGTSVSPRCDGNGCEPAWGAQACLKGSVGQDPASGTFVGLAFHNNNPMSGATGTWTVAGEGIYISVSNPPAVARLQLQEPNTSSNDQRYCAALPLGGTGLIPFSSFKTYCWGDAAHPSKVLAPGTLVHETAVVVPGNANAAVAFDFCLVDIAPR